mmetsp:Transcript_29434/g.45134  ORF Transcript_29434/g.45134 Transcript_29434/m.45134 type:complete len:88 (-) Transcript_29434:47-310(-)
MKKPCATQDMSFPMFPPTLESKSRGIGREVKARAKERMHSKLVIPSTNCWYTLALCLVSLESLLKMSKELRKEQNPLILGSQIRSAL